MKKIGSLCLTLVMLICNISVVNAESYSFQPIWPVKNSNYIGAIDIYAGNKNAHRGVDIKNNGNPTQDVYAVADGKVIAVNNSCPHNDRACNCGDSYGNYVFIQHDINGVVYQSRYAHLSQNSITVNVGQNISKGSKIANMGNSGNSYGAHLHFEIYEGTKRTAENAKRTIEFYINGNNDVLKNLAFKNGLQDSPIYGNWITEHCYYYDGYYHVDASKIAPACSHIYTDPNTEKCNKCGQKFQRIENSENKKYIVNVEKINLKSVPYSKIGNSNGVAYAGEVVTSSANVTNMYGNKWVKITNSKGDVGYICIDNLKEYNPPKNSEINIDLTSYPTSLKQGSNFGLRGTISSANELKRIEGFIKKGNDTVQSTTDYPNKTSVNVKGINLNKNLIFDNLGTGDYTLIVSATDSTGKTVTVKKNFSVYAEQTRADSSLSINLTRYPVTLDAGTSFGLRGSVDSNYSIARVRGYVKDSNGSVVLSSNDTPGSTSMNIQYADLNNSLVFNRLSPGSYTMIVEATDTSGRVVTATKDFSVRSKETYTDNSSSGSGVDGTVQIPSSWDDLSIRTGPSTDYTIVGSMPQGARCTVYPDRTVSGWYYVNYNGIWGYASGRQINLNLGGSAPSNTRVGIINIPSSWDDLSIRTGPSTDYTIVGSMPQGARCTVYPDKANGGWYYVEYNGVQGYAAGNRINLQ